MLLDYYGLHETPGGVRFLLQNEGVTHLLGDGLKIEAKLKPRRAQYYNCPHQIDLTQISDTHLPKNSLVKHFLPLPKERREGILYLPDTEAVHILLQTLQRLSSPAVTTRVTTTFDRPATLKILGLTNLQPLVAQGVTASNPKVLARLQQLLPDLPQRAVILLPAWLATGKYQPPDVDPIRLNAKLEKLPLEQIGARLVTQYLNHQRPEAF